LTNSIQFGTTSKEVSIMNEFYDYEFINEYNSHFNPSVVHARNSYLVKYFTRYNLNKVISCYPIEGMPDEWAENYFY
jgi:hypothetical protein